MTPVYAPPDIPTECAVCGLFFDQSALWWTVEDDEVAGCGLGELVCEDCADLAR